ncbi:MAG TPA: protein kinase [Pirellulaceae bacterium]|jgi:serine/threonine protein kinase/tetratricopeptide (TPR) repeat protein
MDTCIAREKMIGFLAGEMSPHQESKLVEHLGCCPHCRELAEALSDIPLVGARSAGRSAAKAHAADSSLHELQGRLQALAYYDGSGELQCDPTTSTVALSDTWGGKSTNSETAPPRRLGKFEIIRLLGAGGFSVVYLAKDTSLDRLVALKLPRASILADPDARRRFFREAQALARLDHPNIVSVYEAGEQDRTCYLAVEFCDGPTLDDWRRQQSGPVHPDVAARILLALAGAVEHAHDRGILHRDIKPSNVLLCATGENGDLSPGPRLADFGLARIIDADPAQTTLSGVVLGTPHYLAPEQAAGMTDRIGPPTDVYALGAVMYELLTGRPPILGATSIDTLRRVLVDDPAPMRDFVSGVPEDLEQIVGKCLEKSTALRYANARDLAEDLQRFLQRQPVRANARRSLRGRKIRTRFLAASISTAIAISVLACTLGWLAISDRQPTPASNVDSDAISLADASHSTVADAPQQQTPDLENAKVTVHRIIPAPAANSEGGVLNGTSFPFNFAAQMMGIRYQQIYSQREFDGPGNINAIRFRRDEGEPPFASAGIDVRIELAYAGTTVQGFSAEFAANIGAERTTVLDTSNLTLSSQGAGIPRPFDIVIPLTRAFYYDPSRGDLLMDIVVRNAIGTVMFDFTGRGDQFTTRRLYAPLFTSAGEPTKGTLDLGPNSKPAGLVTRFDMEPRRSEQTRFVSAAPIDSSDPGAVLHERTELARDQIADGKYQMAEGLLRKAIEIGHEHLAAEDVGLLEAASLLGESLTRQGKVTDAEQRLLQSHRQLAAVGDAAELQFLASCERLIQLYESCHDSQHATQWRTQWSEARQRHIFAAITHPIDRANALLRLGNHLMKSSDFAAAESPLRLCFAERSAMHGPSSPATISVENRLGECLAALKRFDEAEKYLLASYTTLQELADVPLGWHGDYCQRLVMLYTDWGKFDEIERWKTEWLSSVQREITSLPAFSTERQRGLFRIGRLMVDQEEYAEAEPLFREWLRLRERLYAEHWSIYEGQSYLGTSLLGQQRYEEAEPLLITGYEGLMRHRQEIDSFNQQAPHRAAQRLISLYEQWGKPAQAQRWKQMTDWNDSLSVSTTTP